MVKAQAKMADGRYLLVLGISQGNVDHLKAGEPIYFDPTTLKIEPGATIGAITVFYGRDEVELARTLQSLIGPETEVIAVPRGDDRPH